MSGQSPVEFAENAVLDLERQWNSHGQNPSLGYWVFEALGAITAFGKSLDARIAELEETES